MANSTKKHSVLLFSHPTSFTLEDEFWHELQAIAARQRLSLTKLIEGIDSARTPDINLSSALRLYVLQELKGNKNKNKK